MFDNFPEPTIAGNGSILPLKLPVIQLKFFSVLLLGESYDNFIS
jgi:hypothetical protein